MRSTLAALAVAVVLGGCGEPPVDVTLPARQPGQQVLDLAGVLRGSGLEDRLTALAEDGFDVVALTYESEQAGCGEAFRAGGELVRAWDADVAVVAVARPGDFAAPAPPRERCLGVRPRDDSAVPGDVRERIAEELVPPAAGRNDWPAAFSAAVDALAQARGG